MDSGLRDKVRSPRSNREKAPRETPRENEGTVQALLRALNLLEVMAEDDEGYRLVDLAGRTGLSTSTVHRLLTTLEQKRFVQFDHDNNLWHIGVQCFSVGSVFGRRRNLALLAQPIMRRLRDATGETVNFALADQGDAVFLLQVESRESMRAMARPGGRAPLQCTAVGQSILSAMTEQDLCAILHQHGLPRLTTNSIARPTKLHEALDGIRERGYAIDDEENAIGLRCVAAVIYNELALPFAAVSIAGPTMRVTPRRIPELGQQVISAAGEITRVIGGRLPAQR